MSFAAARTAAAAGLWLMPVASGALPWLMLRDFDAFDRHCGQHLIAAVREVESAKERDSGHPHKIALPPTEWNTAWRYQRVGDGARLSTVTPLGPYEVWLYATGRMVITGCPHGGHRV